MLLRIHCRCIYGIEEKNDLFSIYRSRICKKNINNYVNKKTEGFTNMSKEKETVQIVLQVPKSWVQEKRKEAKEQGKLWSVYAREEILKAIKTKQFTR